MSFFILFDTVGGSSRYEMIRESSCYNIKNKKDMERLIEDVNSLISLYNEYSDHMNIDFISSIPNIKNDDNIIYFVGNDKELRDGYEIVCIKKYNL